MSDGGGDDGVFGPVAGGAGGDDAAAAHDGDGVADAEEFGEVGADEDDGFAGGGEFADEFVDLGFGGDVDAAGGFVEEKDLGVAVEEAADGDFLLVAAGEFGDGLERVAGADAEAIDPGGGGAALVGAVEDGGAGEWFEAWEGEVFGEGEVEHEAFFFAVFAEETEAAGEGARGGGVEGFAAGATNARTEPRATGAGSRFAAGRRATGA